MRTPTRVWCFVPLKVPTMPHYLEPRFFGTKQGQPEFYSSFKQGVQPSSTLQKYTPSPLELPHLGTQQPKTVWELDLSRVSSKHFSPLQPLSQTALGFRV